MNWLQRVAMWGEEELITADPSKHGYQESWGPHHGPVEFKPETWSFGKDGYPHGHPPMPLPRKLYHATPYPDKILEEGIKRPDQVEHQTFGGLKEWMSFTTYESAKSYLQVIRDLITIANGKYDNVNWVAALTLFAEKWKLSESKTKHILQMVENWLGDQKRYGEVSSAHKTRQALLWFFSHAHENVPFLAGAEMDIFDRFKNMSPEDAGIVEFATVPLKWHNNVNNFQVNLPEHYTYNTGENEWRLYDTSVITPLRRVE